MNIVQTSLLAFAIGFIIGVVMRVEEKVDTIIEQCEISNGRY